MDTTPPVSGALQALARRPERYPGLQGLADASGWPLFRFYRAFARWAGETPKQYTQRLRLERATVAVATSSATLLEIALEYGFESHESFTRAFRRQMGATPRDYRARITAAARQPDLANSRQLVRSVGPCLRLYQSNPQTGQEGATMPTSDIALKTLERQPILFIRRRVARNQLQPLFAECFPKIFQHCIQSGIAIAGQPVARYVSTGGGLWTIDSAIPVASDSPSAGDIEAGELPEGFAAVAVHSGAYERLGETHAAIELWIEANGHQTAGAPWESYVTSPAEHPDVADWRTEVVWPLVDASGHGEPS